MKIVIPTYGRSLRQSTWQNLPTSIRERAFLVVQDRERTRYDTYPHMVLPPHIQDVASTRDWIIGWAYPDKVLMLDDDLEFAIRRDDYPWKFRVMTEPELVCMFDDLNGALDDFAHVGISAREGANRKVEDHLFNSRAMRVLGYQSKVIDQHNLAFGPATFMCDFHMTLALLRLGYENCILNTYVNNQHGSNTAGGCSDQRTPEKQREAAEWLKKTHPDFVSIVQKQTKTSWKGESRYDVRIQWKQAYLSGLAVAEVDGGEGANPGTEGVGGTKALER